LDLYPRYEILSCHQRNETRRTSHSQTLKRKWLKSFKPHTRRKQWINHHSCGLKEMSHSSIEETAPYRLITAAREATSQKQTYQEGSYQTAVTHSRREGHNHSHNTAEEKGHNYHHLIEEERPFLSVPTAKGRPHLSANFQQQKGEEGRNKNHPTAAK